MPGEIKTYSENNIEPQLRFCKLSEKASAPTKGSVHAAGYDLKRLVF